MNGDASPVIAVIGDVVEDIVVHVREAIHVASDTDARVARRRGGSAANVASAIRAAGGRSRFIGQVGDDTTGAVVTAMLAADGVELAVRHEGRTGTIVVLVDHTGERSMLADRAACTRLTDPDPAWLDGVGVLHVPFYSLVGEPLAGTTRTVCGWARHRGIAVTVDVSSAAVLEQFGAAAALAAVQELHPTVVMANELEASVLGAGLDAGRLGAVVVVKQGARPVRIGTPDGQRQEIAAETVTTLRDTTGAGDAFAAGWLVAMAGGADWATAAAHGHRIAAGHLRTLASGGGPA